MRRRWGAVLAAIGLLAAVPGAALAGGTIIGEGVHNPDLAEIQDSPGQSHETVGNDVEISFPLGGGDFQGSGVIEYEHTITFEGDPGCTGVYRTTIQITYQGAFSPEAEVQFQGTYVIGPQNTTQDPACPNNGYTYMYSDPLEGPWVAQLDPRNGRITELDGRTAVIIQVDANAVASLIDDPDAEALQDALDQVPDGDAPPPFAPGEVVVFPLGSGTGVAIPFTGDWPPAEPIDCVIGVRTPMTTAGLTFIDGTGGTIGDDLTGAPFFLPDGTIVFPLDVPFDDFVGPGGEVVVDIEGSPETIVPIDETSVGDPPAGADDPDPDPSLELPGAILIPWAGGPDPLDSGTTTTGPTTATTTLSGGDAGGGDSGGGIPFPLVLLIVALIGGPLGVWLWMRSKGPCPELKRAWKEAQRLCDEARRGLADAQREAAARRSDLERLRGELAGLEAARGSSIADSGVTRHQIPGGQVSPEGLEEVIDAKADHVRTAEDAARMADESVAGWQERVDELCAEADKARAAYDECLKEHAAAQAAPAPTPEPEATPPPETEPAVPPEGEAPPRERPASATPTPVPSTPEKCKEGAERWETIDGPHPFRVLDPEGRVAARLTQTVGTRRGVPYHPFRENLPIGDDGTAGYDQFLSIDPASIDRAFGPAVEKWTDGAEKLKSSTPSQITLTIQVPIRTIEASCLRKLRCTGGTWVDTGERQCHEKAGRTGMESFTLELTANTPNPLEGARSLIGQAQAKVRDGREQATQRDQYCNDCKAKKRG